MQCMHAQPLHEAIAPEALGTVEFGGALLAARSGSMRLRLTLQHTRI